MIDQNQTQEIKDLLGDQFPKMIDGFLADTGNMITQMNDFKSNHDLDGIKGYAHTLKSSSFQVGATEIRNIAIHIEQAVEEETLDSLMAQLKQALDDYQSAIQNYL